MTPNLDRSAWRKGQPPRSDCVIKLSSAVKKNDNSRTTNKLLVSTDTPDTSKTTAAVVPPAVPSCHESKAKFETVELASDVSVKTKLEPVRVNKVTLPPLSFAVDSRISSSFLEEKLDRLKAPSYEPNLQWGVAGLIPGYDGPLPSSGSTSPEVFMCPAAVR